MIMGFISTVPMCARASMSFLILEIQPDETCIKVSCSSRVFLYFSHRGDLQKTQNRVKTDTKMKRKASKSLKTRILFFRILPFLDGSRESTLFLFSVQPHRLHELTGR